MSEEVSPWLILPTEFWPHKLLELLLTDSCVKNFNVMSRRISTVYNGAPSTYLENTGTLFHRVGPTSKRQSSTRLQIPKNLNLVGFMRTEEFPSSRKVNNRRFNIRYSSESDRSQQTPLRSNPEFRDHIPAPLCLEIQFIQWELKYYSRQTTDT